MRIYGSCAYGAGNYGNNDAPIISSASLAIDTIYVVYNYTLSDTDKDLCDLLISADLQYSLQVGGSPSSWNDATLYASSVSTNLTSSCTGTYHGNEIYWQWGDDVLVAGSYYLRMKVNDDNGDYSIYVIAGPIALDPADLITPIDNDDYWNYRKRHISIQ